VEFELFLGLWLVSGLHVRQARDLALVCFFAFAGVSLYQALAGAASCGRFGKVSVNPWCTFVFPDRPGLWGGVVE
jgi:hypothetical protein